MKSVYSAVRTGSLNKVVCAQNVYVVAEAGDSSRITSFTVNMKKYTDIYFEELSIDLSTAWNVVRLSNLTFWHRSFTFKF